MLERDKKWGWLFISPWILGLIAFSIIPIVCSLYFSFTDYNIVNPPEFVGFKNYIKAITDPDIYVAYRNTFVFMLMYLPAEIFIGCILAVALNQKFKSIAFFRGLFFTPVIAPMVSVAAIWVMLYNPYGGIFNYILTSIGLEPRAFVFSQNWVEVLASIAVLCVWKGIGSSSIYLLAGLQNISDDIYEAADIDGAGTITKFFKITIPLLTPTIFYLLMIGVISSVNAFDIFKLMAQETSADIGVIATIIYSNAFTSSRVGMASAVGWITFAIVALLTFLQKQMEKRWVYYV